MTCIVCDIENVKRFSLTKATIELCPLCAYDINCEYARIMSQSTDFVHNRFRRFWQKHVVQLLRRK